MALFVALGWIVFASFILVYSSFASGFVLYKFYYWFLIPVFPSVPHLGFMECVGIMIFLLAVKSSNGIHEIKDEFKKDETTRIVIDILKPIIILGVGWFLKVIIF